LQSELSQEVSLSQELQLGENVSRKYLYCQKQKAETALDKAFSPVNEASDVLFNLPVTKELVESVSERPERVGKSPTELMTGKPHPHWLELLGFEKFKRSTVHA